jgi:UDP-N-acetylmuramate dehydrogenase
MFSPRLRARFERQEEEERHLTGEQRDALARSLADGRVVFGADMREYTSFGTGGIAEALAKADDVDALRAVVSRANDIAANYLFIGCGTKTVIRDEGLSGLAIGLGEGFKSIELISESDAEAHISVGAAIGVQTLAAWCAERGYIGMENLLHFGGTLGGCIKSNSSTCGFMMSDAVDEVTLITKELKGLTIKGRALRFEEDGLKIPGTAAVIKAVLKVKKCSCEDAAGRYRETLQDKKIFPADAKVLRNVFMDAKKTKAEDLICDAGLIGVRIGGARVSGDNPNVIVNEGQATSRNAVVLMNLMRDRIRQATGLTLETKINIVGNK